MTRPYDHVQEFCRSLPGVTEDLKWGHNLTFLVGEKIFAILSLDETPARLSFKTTPEFFEFLTQQSKIVPAPYLARNKWVMLEELDALPQDELEARLRESYHLIMRKLTKKLRRELGDPELIG